MFPAPTFYLTLVRTHHVQVIPRGFDATRPCGLITSRVSLNQRSFHVHADLLPSGIPQAVHTLRPYGPSTSNFLQASRGMLTLMQTVIPGFKQPTPYAHLDQSNPGFLQASDVTCSHMFSCHKQYLLTWVVTSRFTPGFFTISSIQHPRVILQAVHVPRHVLTRTVIFE